MALNKYFDHNATAPLFTEAKAAFLEAYDNHWQNPSSLYPSANEVKSRMEESREALAQYLTIDDAERIVFTGGATEANNLVIRHCTTTNPSASILVSAVEHPSVLEPAKRYCGQRLVTIRVDEKGVLDLEALDQSLCENPSVCLVSIMAANNETGVLQPWSEANALCQQKGVPLHCDATQWIGKRFASPLSECDWLSGSAHKFGGPKGVGFLVAPKGLHRLEGSQAGGPQENGLRAGTENYPAIAAMQAALFRVDQLLPHGQDRARDRDHFETGILRSIQGIRVCGADAPRLWNTSMLILPEHKNLKWITRLNDLGFALSTGSACSSGKGNPSHVMEAMGLDYDEMGRVLRISSGWETTSEDWRALAAALVDVHQSLHSQSRRKTRSKTISLTNLGQPE